MVSRRQFLLGAAATGLLASCGVSAKKNTKDEALVLRAKVGAYINNPTQESNPISADDITTFESRLGRQFNVVNYFFAWGSNFQAAVNSTVPRRDLMISWQPQGSDLTKIVAGKYDPYIAQYAVAAKSYGSVVYLRFAAEMNGDGNNYSAGSGGPPPATFVLAWHRIHGIFQTVGATNVRFVWCINETDIPATTTNKAENYWPGDNYVDIVGFDGYNWGSAKPAAGDGTWRTFNQIVETPYQRLATLSKRPIWICEFGCAEASSSDPAGVSKGGWFQDMFATKLYPRLEGLVYFSENEVALKRDWRINSSVGAITGWRTGWLSA
jgi:beta-mannanase